MSVSMQRIIEETIPRPERQCEPRIVLQQVCIVRHDGRGQGERVAAKTAMERFVVKISGEDEEDDA